MSLCAKSLLATTVVYSMTLSCMPASESTYKHQLSTFFVQMEFSIYSVTFWTYLSKSYVVFYLKNYVSIKFGRLADITVG